MRTSSLESKTIRPGLNAYSFYRSDRHPYSPPPVKTRRHSPAAMAIIKRALVVAVVLLAVVIGYRTATSSSGHSPSLSTSASTKASSPAPQPAKAPAVATPVVAQPKPCGTGNGAKSVVISISARHLWACANAKQIYDAPVITGMEAHESTKTPLGTYHIYTKQTDVTLKGSDETGSWNDPVHYWLPFLDNQYGTYGFHDATWRPGNPFGTVDPNTADASHGCVEVPLDTSAWLYKWAEVGTTVIVES